MTFVEALAVLGRRWRILVVGVLVGLLVAGAAAAIQPARFVAESGVYVSGLDTVPAPGADFYTNYILVEQRTTTYRDLLLSRRVLEGAAARIGAPLEPGTVSVTPGGASSVLGVTVVGDDPARTVAIASAVAQSFVDTLAEVAGPPVRGSIVGGPFTAVPVGSGLGAMLLAGLLGGLGLAGTGVVVREVVTRGRGRPAQGPTPEAVR